MSVPPITAAAAQALRTTALATSNNDRALYDTIGFINGSISTVAGRLAGSATIVNTVALRTFLVRVYPTGLTIVTDSDCTPAFKAVIVATYSGQGFVAGVDPADPTIINISW